VAVNKKENKHNTKKTAVSVTSDNPWYLNSYVHIFLLLLAGYFSYSTVGKFDFTNWDEKRYLFETPMVQKLTWQNIKLMFSNKVLESYNPLALLSLSVDYSFAGAKASWYHWHNVILHLVNGLLLYWCLQLLTNNRVLSFFCAALFLTHPMHTEAVTWIAGRKDVLYTFFFFAAMGLYIKNINLRNQLFYIGAILLFLLSLFAKSQAVVLPVLLFLILWYKQNLTKTNVLQLIPFFILSIIFGLITLTGGNKGLTADEYGASFTFIEKIFLSSHAYILYLIKCFLPFSQSALYAFNASSINGIETISYASILIVPAWFAAIYFSYKKSPSVFFGIVFFTICTALILHVVATNSSLIYERFTYISYVGLFFSVGILLYDKLGKEYFFYTTLVLAVLLAIATKNRNEAWKNSETLWTDVIEKQPNISAAYNNRGNVYYQQANWNKALADFQKAIEFNPKYPNSYSNRGSVNIYLGKFKESLQDNEKALTINPKFAEAWLGKGVALYNLNRLPESVECYNKAISLIPNFPNAYNNRGGSYFKMKEYDKAINDFNTALRLSNNYDEARVNLALVLMEQKKFLEAEQQLLQVTTDARKNSSLSDLYLKQGLFAYQQGKPQEAIDFYNKAIDVFPQNAEAWYNLGGTYLMQQNIVKAKECWSKVLEINPAHTEAAKWLKQIN